MDLISLLGQNESVMDLLKKVALSTDQDEAFLVMNAGAVLDSFDTWTKELPDVTPYYAVKCNNSTVVLRILAALGAGFDCASKAEIAEVLSFGVSPDRIIFANPAKKESHLKYAAETGVIMTTYDNAQELHKIKEYHSKAKLLLRIRADSKYSPYPRLGVKFGAESATALELIRTAVDLGLDVIGVCFHVGSLCREIDAYRRALTECRRIFDEVERTLGFKLSFVDIGGGFNEDFFSSMARTITTSLDELFPRPTQVKFIAEPGRFFVEAAFSLATRIHSLSIPLPLTIHSSPKYFVDDGAFGSLNSVLFDDSLHLIPEIITKNEINNKELYNSSIWGPTCDSFDVINKSCRLPLLQAGDWLVFHKLGAYSIVLSSTFNGFPRSKIHHVAERHHWLRLKDLIPHGVTEVELPYWFKLSSETHELMKLA